MFENVVVGVKDRESGRDALALARRLAAPDGTLTLASVYVAVLVPSPDDTPGWEAGEPTPRPRAAA